MYPWKIQGPGTAGMSLEVVSLGKTRVVPETGIDKA